MNLNKIKPVIFIIALLILISCSANEGLISNSLNTYLYFEGKSALDSKDTARAEKYFKESISEFDDTNSQYELAKIYRDRNTISYRNKAMEILRRITFIEPKNVEYRLAFAKLMRIVARISSISEFENVIALDSSNVEAWLNLAEMKDDDFTEYNNSVRVVSDEFWGSMQGFANEDFQQAKEYYETALKYDSTNYKANLNLALLNEKAGKPKEGIPYLEKLIDSKRDDKNVHLCLGLLLYKTQKLKDCFAEYKKALKLMNEEEREDFTINSVKLLVEPAYKEFVDTSSDYELRKFIDVYWKVSDPLYLTEYNERLLEHYSRVTFADLHFSVSEMGKVGWKTDRGEAVLRFGEPDDIVRIRPSMEADGLFAKTELWDYNGLELGFMDFASSGNFLLSAPDAPEAKIHTQAKGDSQFLFESLKQLHHSYYNPIFEGPKFDIQYSIAQFKSLQKRNHTDLYVNYILNNPDLLYSDSVAKLSYKTGLFFFDKHYEKLFDKIMSYDVNKSDGDILVKSLNAVSISDSGYASFELIRNSDKGTSANRTNLKIRKFSNYSLCMSDILIADNVSTKKNSNSIIIRNKIKIKPNPINVITKDNPFYIYYEVYNLKKGNNNFTDFDQKIAIREFEEQKTGIAEAANSFLDFLGFGKKEEVTLTSNYQTPESDPQIFFQLDLNNYNPGKYLITITIEDKIRYAIVAASAVVDWRN